MYLKKKNWWMIVQVSIIILSLSIILNWIACTKPQTVAPLIPMKDFFKNPDQTDLKLSPDGDYISLLQPYQTRMNVFVRKIDSDTAIRITNSTDRDIYHYFWAGKKRIAYLKDQGGNENYHLYAVDLDGSNFKDLTPFENVKVDIVDDLKDNDDEMLIMMNKNKPQVFDVYRINTYTGELRMIAENPGTIIGWITDHNGTLRVEISSDGVNTSLLYREKESEPFKTMVTTNFKEMITPLFFTFDNQYLYVSSNVGRDKAAIMKYDIANGKEMELIYEHPEVDVVDLLKSDKRNVILGVVYTTDKNHYEFFDQERKTLQIELEKQLPGYDVTVASVNRDENKYLLRTQSDRSLGSYYFYNVVTRELKKLVDVSPWLNDKDMAPMKPIQYKSRDGLTITGYLTIPLGMEGKKLPVVINPHGGPWDRDRWKFNPEVQFLANRGYAVLQMNYRGSTGYGRAFWEASFKKWGKEMQNDITDGVNWLIQQGIVDSGRIGIYGGSYGGYAVLAGLTFTPELYACGVDYVGISNIFTLMQTIPAYWEPLRQMFYEMVGNPQSDSLALWEASPVFHADRIRAPLFIAQGANDPRVKKIESDQIVEALKKRGIDVPYMVKENEGHGFSNEENNFDFYRTMEEFLGKYLGGRVETIPASAKQ